MSSNRLGFGATPTFSYPSTAMTGWLCRSVYNPNNNNCTTNYTQKYCPNNSSPQGEIFCSQITSSNLPPNYNLYAVDNCGGSEGVIDGTVAALSGESGLTAIQYDMAGGGPNNLAAGCVHRAH
jgi:hypothetical protein